MMTASLIRISSNPFLIPLGKYQQWVFLGYRISLDGIPDEDVVDVDICRFVNRLPHGQRYILRLQHLVPVQCTVSQKVNEKAFLCEIISSGSPSPNLVKSARLFSSLNIHWRPEQLRI